MACFTLLFLCEPAGSGVVALTRLASLLPPARSEFRFAEDLCTRSQVFARLVFCRCQARARPAPFDPFRAALMASSMLDLKLHPHRRLNLLTGEWILVSPHRTRRPWQGQVEKAPPLDVPDYEPGCYLCPGNARAAGAANPAYTGTFVFDNDFAALLPETPAERYEVGSLLKAEGERGVCRVVCFSPRHNLTLSRMAAADLRKVVDVWTEQYADLGSDPAIDYVETFENRGAMMGCSNPHPHCQIWATRTVPNEPLKEQNSQIEYLRSHGVPLLADYLEMERRTGDRLVCENDHFAAVVPFWAMWPFETIVLPKRPVRDFTGLTDGQKDALAAILKRITTRYDNLFETSFPYSMGFHAAPTDGKRHEEWVFHAHFYPPLLRSATVKKFMVGFEMLAMPQRDITPESAAGRLREMSEKHYLDD